MVGCFYTQTEYSLLDNMIPIDKLVSTAKMYGYKCLSIADNDSMYGVLKFYQSCKEHGIKPVIGINVTIESLCETDTKILLYAKDDLGYQNLLKIASYVALNGKVLFSFLEKHKKHIFAISAVDNDIYRFLLSDKVADVKKTIKKYREIFENYYIGIMNQSIVFDAIVDLLMDVATTENVPLLPIQKSAYLNRTDAEAFKYYNAIKTGKPSELDGEYHFKTISELQNDFSEYSFVFDELENLVKDIDYSIKKSNVVLPKFPTPDKISSEEYLKELSLFGLKKRLEGKKCDINTYQKRLLYEIEVIVKMGYEDYFLIVWDFIKYAKKRGIMVGPGRGSAAGSLTSYCLGITDVDPILYGLLFERFLNPERVSMPDIDVDFPDDKRDEVIKYVAEKYGKNRVAHIVTFGTFQARLALRDMSRTINLPSYKLDNVLKFISSNDDLVNYSKHPQLGVMAVDDTEIDRLLSLSKKILYLPKNTSTHAAGIVLSEFPLDDVVPLSKGMNGVCQTQFEADDLKRVGLLKIDFLGIRNLKIIDCVVKLIRKECDFSITSISFNDSKTFNLLSEADTNGIFQLESDGMKNVLKKLKPSAFEDVVAVLALYRPGPLDNIDEYIARKRGKKFDYMHQLLKPYLEQTYGIIVYQEQIMQIFQGFAGYSLGEADILRRAMSEKNRSVLTAEREKFVKCANAKGIDINKANEVYDYIVRFANYGFNRSHSVAYGIVAYQMAYLKAHYPLYFIAMLLNNAIGAERQTLCYIKEARQRKIEVFPPDINISTNEYIIDKGIRLPLLSIKGVGGVLANQILLERSKGPFKNFSDFMTRINPAEKILENMIFAGCFESFGKTKRELNYLSSSESVYDRHLSEEIVDEKEEYDIDFLREQEVNVLGFNIKYSMLCQYKSLIEKYRLLDLSDLNASLLDKRVNILANIQWIREIFTKNNEPMAFLTLSNGIIDIEGVVFTEEYKNLKNMKPGVAIIGGILKERNNKLSIVILAVKEELK